MRGPHWGDDKVEKHLNELPNVKDEQAKDELYEMIKNRIDMGQGKSRVKTNKRLYKKQWFFPNLASAAAVFILLLIIPSFMTDDELSSGNRQFVANQAKIDANENTFQEESYGDNINNKKVYLENHDAAEMNENTDDSENEAANEEVIEETDMEVIAIPYIEDVQMEDALMLQVMIAGVSIDELGDMGNTKEELLFNILSNNFVTSAVNIEGLKEVIINGTDNEVTLDFNNPGRLEGLSSSETIIYRSSIMEILSVYGFEKVHFTVNGEPGLMIGQTGVLEYTWDLPYENRGYYSYTNADGKEFFLRGVSISEWSLDEEGKRTFSDTLEDMRNVKENAWYEPIIPKEMQFNEIKEEEGEVTITLAADSPLSDRIIETIKLAASDFSFDYVTIINKHIERTGEDIQKIKIPPHPIPYLESNQ